MSSNINLVDKLNPTSFEQNGKLQIKINPETSNTVIKNNIVEKIKENKKENKTEDKNPIKDIKITISLSKDEENLIELERLQNKCLNDLDNILIKAKERKNSINDIDVLNKENSLKKKLLLKNPLLNPHFNLF
ncbi:hypothetical protein [Buchnera aphidicola]|uniref:Uncharacterized protein n=1 Tax=Buchnera aphidicola (Aphis nerii) TaxID=1241835 RepID=A0A4D6XPA0_9GAMM|nr:hypothetical protein [Buchnera aphidicola]QCI19092.1 hypothetical protein D9V64_02980 [Buchnera aphidicola (Aphis nerii)]